MVLKGQRGETAGCGVFEAAGVGRGGAEKRIFRHQFRIVCGFVHGTIALERGAVLRQTVRQRMPIIRLTAGAEQLEQSVPVFETRPITVGEAHVQFVFEFGDLIGEIESRDEAVPLLGRQRGDHEAHAIAAAEIAPECAPDGIAEPFAVAAAIEHFGHGAAIGHGPDGDIAERHADFAALAARVAVAQPSEQGESAIGAGDEVPGG